MRGMTDSVSIPLPFRDRGDLKIQGRMEYPSPTQLRMSHSTMAQRCYRSALLSFSFMCPPECFDDEVVDQLDLIKLVPRTKFTHTLGGAITPAVKALVQVGYPKWTPYIS